MKNAEVYSGLFDNLNEPLRAIAELSDKMKSSMPIDINDQCRSYVSEIASCIDATSGLVEFIYNHDVDIDTAAFQMYDVLRALPGFSEALRAGVVGHIDEPLRSYVDEIDAISSRMLADIRAFREAEKQKHLDKQKRDRGMEGATNEDLFRKIQEEHNTRIEIKNLNELADRCRSPNNIIKMASLSLQHRRQNLQHRKETDQKIALLIESDDKNVQFFEALLATLGYVTIVDRGEKALTLARFYLPDLIQARVANSGLVRRIKQDERTRHIPIIAVDLPFLAHSAVIGGFDGFISTPISSVSEYTEFINQVAQAGK